jgi:hypothetical protein
MKQLIVFSIVALALFSCTGNKKQADASDKTYELDNLLTVADQKVDETVTVVGYVTHTCKHSGKRCFIVGESQQTSLRVEAEGDIESFSSELIGSKLAITGILKEYHLSGEFIDEMENDVKELEQEEGMAETCAAELSNINDMRKWMQDHEKNYFVIYYMDGLKFDVLD